METGNAITEQWRQIGSGGQLGGNGENITENGVVSYALIGICTTATISAGTTEAICEDAEFSLTAFVSSFGAFEGGIIQILDSNNDVVAFADVTLANKQVQYSLPNETAGTYTYSARYARSTPTFRYQGSMSATTSTVEVIECGGCDETFSYVANEGGSYTFTYQSEVDGDGAEVKFTTPHVTAVTPEDGKTYTTNPSNGPGSPTISTWIGDITACTPITFNLTFTPDCDQNEAGFANLWTDFKVNDVSKRGISETNEIIKFVCS